MPNPIHDPAYREHMARAMALKIAESLLWTPYLWAGDDPSGLDCSGMMIEVLKSVGKLPYTYDDTAHGLYNRFKVSNSPKPGDLVFWWRSGYTKISHVEMVYDIDLQLSIGAAGGGSSTLDESDAWEHNAYVRIRPWKGRGPKLAGFRDPY
jgi:hypothetical protein